MMELFYQIALAMIAMFSATLMQQNRLVPEPYSGAISASCFVITTSAAAMLLQPFLSVYLFAECFFLGGLVAYFGMVTIRLSKLYGE